MTTTQPRYPFTRWIDAPLAAIRYLNEEQTGAGGAMAAPAPDSSGLRYRTAASGASIQRVNG